MPKGTGSIIPIERIQQCIYLVRKHKVMLDSDLAQLYGVETGPAGPAVVNGEGEKTNLQAQSQ